MLNPNFKLTFEKKNRFLVEKKFDFLWDAGGRQFWVTVFKRPRNAIRNSEIHLVMGEVAFLMRNRLKELFKVEFWLHSFGVKHSKNPGFVPSQVHIGEQRNLQSTSDIYESMQFFCSFQIWSQKLKKNEENGQIVEIFGLEQNSP